nr:immunoglobulin light chain junction region [Mus musculus]NSL97248.1 immunoglobulin light chain junction region [Mus musculus]NSL97372.1 immunoglobulin light chain junction region [Mus musculus]NSL97391.1 immunoglobulin light chain junction region [Mus musculus]NSL97637.1 immunoglobulin light chain junction region [Mus musculus]
CLQYDEFPLTF